jgi:hypothetical protein
MSYESPVEIICRGFTAKLEGDLMEAVHNYCVSVDKDELIKALQYDRNQYEKGFADGWRLHESKWISVEERLPDILSTIIVCDKKGNVGEAYYYGEGSFQWIDGDLVIVTHWMPLPEPPKGE